ncbi:MAG: transcription antitermination factor NusB [Planctomycetota bacterium]
MRKRTLAREIALQALYQLEIKSKIAPVAPEDLESFFHTQTKNQPVIEFARLLLQGVSQNQNKIDSLIQETAHNWEFSRLAILDKNILRLAIYELLFCDDIPPAVSINEAVDLAKKYGSAESGAFVNGILDKIAPNKPETPKTGK